MKIIAVDNFDREYVSNSLIAENVSDYWSKQIVKLLNDKLSSDHSAIYFKVVDDNHKLYTFEP